MLIQFVKQVEKLVLLQLFSSGEQKILRKAFDTEGPAEEGCALLLPDRGWVREETSSAQPL